MDFANLSISSPRAFLNILNFPFKMRIYVTLTVDALTTKDILISAGQVIKID